MFNISVKAKRPGPVKLSSSFNENPEHFVFEITCK